MGDLQLFSFIINEETVDDAQLYTFELPQSIKNIYKEISSDKKNSIAYKTIFKVASCCFPSIIHCNNRLYDIEKDDNIWFYAVEQFDLDILKTKVTEWLRIEYKERLQKKLEEKFEGQWEWNNYLSLKDIVKEKKGSAYSLIPNYYIYLLAKEEFSFECLGKNLKFNRVVGEDKAMMMTLPIELEKKVYSPFSYAIDSKLVLPIDTDTFCLNFWLHIKLWENRSLVREKKSIKNSELEDEDNTPVSFLSRYESTTFYVYKENPYLFEDTILFNSVPIRKKEEGIGIQYVEKADEIFTTILEVNLEQSIVKEEANKGTNDEIILVTRKNRGKKLTQYGAGLPERNEMLGLIADKLPKLKIRDQIKYLDKPSNTKLSEIVRIIDELNERGVEIEYFGDEESKLKKKTSKYSYITPSVYKKITIYVASSTKDLYEKVVEVCRLYLRLQRVEDGSFENLEGKIFKIERTDNIFCTPINSKDKESKNNKVITIDIEDRKKKEEEIKAIINQREKDELLLAIIDLKNYAEDTRVGQKQDPKNLIRNTLRNKQVITQFIDYQDREIIIDKVVNTVKDLLSAAGFMEATTYEEGILGDKDILVGIGKISTGENDNILAMTRITKGNIQINIFGINKWMSIQDYIFKLNEAMFKKMKIELSGIKGKIVREEINHWIMSELIDSLEQGSKVYTFVDYSLRNKLWSSVRNKDFLECGQMELVSKENLRMIRINGGEEIPEYYIASPKKNNLNKESGIFKGEKDTYYLVGRRSDTDQVRVTATKCDEPTKSLKRPSLQEINIQLCESDQEKDEIARLTQILRGVNISYDNHTMLPLPLYCMARITEYIRAMKG